MTFADAEPGKADALADEVGGEAVESLGELAESADVLLLAVKPNALEDVAEELHGRAPALLSILAVTAIERVQGAFAGVPVMRAMPNLPVQVGRGVVCYSTSLDFPAPLAERLIRLLDQLGTAVPIEERLIDVAMAVMSCSPAYLALVAETLVEAGEREGLDRDLATRLVTEALAGTAELLVDRDPDSILRAVTSPGGATEAGLAVLDQRDLRGALDEAVGASLERLRG
jgi:pyrroline-5-carboxylate reductase